jgi:hypothetical protein
MKNKLNGWRAGLAGLLVAAGLFGGCDTSKPIEVGKTETLRVSETAKVVTPDKYVSFDYAGMPNPETFCINGRDTGNELAPYYYPIEANEIYFRGVKLKVLSVNPNEIKLEQAN